MSIKKRPNKALHRTAIPLRSIATVSLGVSWMEFMAEQIESILSITMRIQAVIGCSKGLFSKAAASEMAKRTSFGTLSR